jgi:TonB family protein
MFLLALALAAQPTPPFLKGGGLFVSEDYPVGLEGVVEGTVRFTLDVGTNGRAFACRIDKSSGSPTLDRTTCRLATERAKFEPARDANGQPATGTWSSSVTWKIPSASQQLIWTITFQTEGGATSCLASHDHEQRKVRADICDRMVSAWLKTHTHLPDQTKGSNLIAPLTADMLEP